MNKYSINNLPCQVVVAGNYDSDTCIVELSDQAIEAIKKKTLKIEVRQTSDRCRLISNLEFRIFSMQGHIKIFVGDCGNVVFFDEGTLGNYHLTLGRNCQVTFGSRTTSGHVRIFCDNTKFICGEDCMFSDGIVIQSVAQHGIVDLESESIVNNHPSEMILGNHVWLGRNATLTAKASIGDGSVIGIGSIVVNKIPGKVIAAGVPAKIIKKGTTWSRSLVAKDAYAKKYIDEHEKKLSIPERFKSLFSRLR